MTRFDHASVRFNDGASMNLWMSASTWEEYQTQAATLLGPNAHYAIPMSLLELNFMFELAMPYYQDMMNRPIHMAYPITTNIYTAVVDTNYDSEPL